MIGSLGEIIFEVSAGQVRTFDNLSRSGEARWALFEIIGRKPAREFLGAGLDSITFDITLLSAMGLNVAEELKALRTLRDKGEPVEFILNDAPISDHLWTLNSVDEKWRNVTNTGLLLSSVVSLYLMEYRRDPEEQVEEEESENAAE